MLVKFTTLVIYTSDMYNNRKDTKEENELRRKYEPRNIKNQTKQSTHKDQEWNLTINTD